MYNTSLAQERRLAQGSKLANDSTLTIESQLANDSKLPQESQLDNEQEPATAMYIVKAIEGPWDLKIIHE